jgi:hypothetical protein
MKTLLIVLPYAGLVLSAFAGIWGLTHELTTKDENNRRHLTTAGKYSVAFVLLGLFISFNTAVLKTITDNQDRNAAKQAEELANLARQQKEEATEERRRSEARETQAKIDREAQEGRDRALGQQQRDLALSQQQIQGFNKAERFARQRTLAELQRSHRILFNVNRGQYPLTAEIKLAPVIKISTKHPIFKNYYAQIQKAAQQLSGDEVDVKEDSALLPPKKSLARSYLTHRVLNFSIYVRGRNDILKSEPDFSFAYSGDVFGEFKENNGNIQSWLFPLRYRKSDLSFITRGPTAYPLDATHSTGKVMSYLDLPGSTLVIFCNDMEADTDNLPIVSSNCNENMSIESIYITTPFGVELELPGGLLKREKERGLSYFTHKFNPDVEHFFETYLKRD